MIKDYKEAFEKTRLAGNVAAKALDEVAKIAKPGTRTDEIDNLCYEFLNDNGAYSAPLFTEVFQNLAAHQLIMLFVMEYLQIKY